MGKQWKDQTAKDGKEIKTKLVPILQSQSSMNLIKLYTYGDNWGRGGEVLYQAFGLKMSKGQHDLTKKRVGLK